MLTNALVEDIGKVLSLLDYQIKVYGVSELPVTQEILNKFLISENDFRFALRTIVKDRPGDIEVTYEHADGNAPTGENWNIEFFIIKVTENFNPLLINNLYQNELPENQVYSGSLRPANSVGKLEEYSDGSIRVVGKEIKIRNELKDICRLFIKNAGKTVLSDDIKKVLGRQSLSHKTIGKYVSELRIILQPYFEEKLFRAQYREGWILDLENES
jgi:hypothetical protein